MTARPPCAERIMAMASGEIVYNKQLTPVHFLMGLDWQGSVSSPGQFVMLRVGSGYDPLLRRPFGIYNVTEGGSRLEVLYKVVGRGTAIMAAMKPGEEVDILGPLGRGFPAPGAEERVIMVAGGIGIAPLHMFALGHSKSVLLYGARESAEASLSGDVAALGLTVKLSTEDGSAGSKGLVTDHLAEELAGGGVVYACGPMGMLKAVSAMAAEAGVRAYVSLENTMACGVGACLGCAVRFGGEGVSSGKHGAFRMVCSEGPVFESTEIDWGAE